MEMTIPIVIAVIGTLGTGGLIGVLLTHKRESQKQEDTTSLTLIAALTTRLGALETRIDVIVNSRIEDWEKYQAKHIKDAQIKRKMGDHIDVLEDHIWKGLAPPPPAKPDDI